MVKYNKLAKVALFFLDELHSLYPNAEIELCFNKKDPWQLLVAVVLSAQCTDIKVNKATPALFDAYENVFAFAEADNQDIEPYIRSLGLFRNKAKNLVQAAKIIVSKYGGVIPEQRKQLESLPGVGSKSAAVIIANAFNQPAIAVDTHVKRIAFRLGLTKETNPDKVETDLTKLFPKNRLLEAHHSLIWHGRRMCFAQNPMCSKCPLQKKCPKVGVIISK